MFPYDTCMDVNLPTFSADLLLYKGYSSFHETVLHTNSRLNQIEHCALSCMVILDSACHKVHVSHCVYRVYILCSICASGNPLFCHCTGYILHCTNQITSCFAMKSVRDFSFCVKTYAVMSCLYTGD